MSIAGTFDWGDAIPIRNPNDGDEDEEAAENDEDEDWDYDYDDHQTYDYDKDDDQFFEEGTYPVIGVSGTGWYAFYLALHRNDADITAVSAIEASYGDRRRPLGKALRFNTHVVTLQFSLQNVYPSNEYYDRENSTYLQDFIRESPALRTIVISEGVDQDEWFVHGFLEAIADNPRLEYIRLYMVELLPSIALVRLVETTQALKRLCISWCSFVQDDEFLRLLPEAIAANRTLESLSFDGRYVSNSFAVNLLDHLGRQQSSPNLSLKELQLDPCFTRGSQAELDLALNAFLRNPSYSLDSLTFECNFSFSGMQLFLEALTENSTLSILSICGGEMDDEATDMFIEYMQTWTTQRVLALTTGYLRFGSSRSIGTVAATILRQSPLQILHIENKQVATDLGDFYADVASHASSIGLCRLVVDRVCLNDVQSFLQCLPVLVCVRELDVSSVSLRAMFGADPRRFTSRDVVQALRQNGSFYSVTIGETTSMPSTHASTLHLNAMERRLVDCFAIRNRMVPLLLSNPIGEGRDGTRTGRRRRRRRRRPNSRLSTTWRQFPELMLSAQQTPRIAPNSVLTGLLALDQSIAGVRRHRHPCTRWEQQVYQLRGLNGNMPSDFLAMMRAGALQPGIVSNFVTRSLQRMSDPVFVGPLELVVAPSREDDRVPAGGMQEDP